MSEYVPTSRYSMLGAETKIAQLTEERTEARAEAFRAQERVRELEAELRKLREENARLTSCSVCGSDLIVEQGHCLDCVPKPPEVK